MPLNGQRDSLTVTEKRALAALRESADAWGRPVIELGYSGGIYIRVANRKAPGVGTIPQTVQVRRATMAGLRDKGLVDVNLRPIEETSSDV